MNNEYEIFFNEYTDKIDEYYNLLKKKKKKAIIATTIFTIILILVFVIGTLGLELVFENGYLLQILGSVVIAVVAFLSIIVKMRRELYKINEKVIHDIIKYISKDDNCIYSPNKRISSKNIQEMELFNFKTLKYNGKNAISANYNNNMMNFADMEVYYYKDKITEQVQYDSEGRQYTKIIKDKIKKTVFNGCYIGATLNKKIAAQIYLIPNNLEDIFLNGAINEYITYSGNKLELENLEFSEKYRVYSDDEIQARYILSLKLMEQINQIDDLFSGKKYIVFKEGRRFAICIQDFRIEDLRKALLPFNKNSNKLNENLNYIFKNIYNLFNIYNILDLGNDVYTDNYVDKK